MLIEITKQYLQNLQANNGVYGGYAVSVCLRSDPNLFAKSFLCEPTIYLLNKWSHNFLGHLQHFLAAFWMSEGQRNIFMKPDFHFSLFTCF